MCFTHTSRAKEHKGSDRMVRSFQPYTATQNRFGKFLYRNILSYHLRLQFFLHSSQFKSFCLRHTLYGYTGHHRNNISYFFFTYRLAIILQTGLPLNLHLFQADRKFLLTVTVAGSQLKILRLYSFSLQASCLFNQLFLLLNFFRNVNIRQMHTRTSLVQSINSFIREVTIGNIAC